MGASYSRSSTPPSFSNDSEATDSFAVRKSRRPQTQKSEENNYNTDGTDTSESRKGVDSIIPGLKKRSQSLDAGRLTHHRKLGSRVEKFRRKSRKKSVDSIEKERKLEHSLSEKGVEEEVEPKMEETPPEELSDKQKRLIKDSWKILQENVARVGVVVFMGLFETHPDVQEVFLPFRGLATEELRESKKLRSHALRVMSFVEKGVSRIDKPDKLIPLIEELGRNHVKYGVQPDVVDFVGPQFLLAIRPTLGDQWSEDVESAWNLFFETLSFVMKKSMREKSS